MGWVGLFKSGVACIVAGVFAYVSSVTTVITIGVALLANLRFELVLLPVWVYVILILGMVFLGFIIGVSVFSVVYDLINKELKGSVK